LELSSSGDDSLIVTVTAFITKQQLLQEQGRVIVAVSGGADSLCLLHLLHRLCGAGKYFPEVRLHVVHLDHQLRESSAYEAAQIERMAKDWGLAVTVGRRDVASLAHDEHRSLEEAARVARYDFLRQVAQGDAIAVAHHADDQAETLLLHMLRGGGLASQIGLQARQNDIIRPLLCVTHADTLAYCARHQLHPFEDESNNDPRFLRNRIRHELLPLLTSMNAGIRETLVRNAQVISVDLAWVEEQVDGAWSSVVLQEDDRHATLHISVLQALPLSLQRHLIRRVCAHLCDGQAPLELRHYQLIEEAMRRAHHHHSASLHMPGQLVVEYGDDILVFKRTAKHAEGSSVAASKDMLQNDEIVLALSACVPVPGTPWLASAEVLPEALCAQVGQALVQEDWSAVWQLLPRTKTVAYIDAAVLGTTQQDKTAHDILVRSRRPGDRIQVLGMAHEKKVKDVLIDEHVPYGQRASIPLFFASGHCLWIGGVRLDERARLHRHTRQIIRLAITRRTDA
jgi:tRNA(Ile)-lysidine synthase